MKDLSLIWKLTLAFVLIALLTAGLVSLFIRVTSVDRLQQLLLDQQLSSLQTALVDYYQSNGSWAGIDQEWDRIRLRSLPTQFAPTSVRGGQAFGDDSQRASGSSQPNRERRRFFGLADANGTVLVSVDPQYPTGSIVPTDRLQSSRKVLINGKQVGTILMPQLLPGLNPEERLFLQRTNEALVFGMLGATLVALLIGILLARTLVRPLQALTLAAQNIAHGELEQQVQVKTRDELGQLADAFNLMSQEVALSNRLRRQMTADIAHDLRTPLTVIGGYIESMRDGVLKPTPERLSLIYTEIERLQNLVGDLRMLTQADAGELPLNPQPVSPVSLLEHATAPFQHRANIQQVSLSVQPCEGLPDVRVDEARMMQVFGNLITNALRYTPAGGSIQLSARGENGQVVLVVQDTGSGIPAEDLPYIFDRFYRVDKSRTTDTGESGLGLAIVKALVEAHGGEVHAESASGSGTAVMISLPTS